jgi:tRNA-Thr(GGU) m(6)t(6)A37 methyltransferase TsaA
MNARKAGDAPHSRSFRLRPIGVIRSDLEARGRAPRQGSEGAPDAWLDVEAWASRGLQGVVEGARVLIVTWLHRGRRDVLRVRPRSDRRRRLAGVFATRSPDRPNPLGLHAVTVREVVGSRLRIGPIEAIDGTPVVDIKPALGPWES